MASSAAPAMAAILRSGKFLRLFSGVARNLAAANGGKPEEGGNGSGIPAPGHGPFGGPGYGNDLGWGQCNISIQNVLPYLGVSDAGHAEERYPTRILSSPSRNLVRVSKYEIELMIEDMSNSKVDAKNSALLSSQALLTIRLCGTVLDQEILSERTAIVNRIWNLIKEKSIPINVAHYNAFLRVNLENRNRFDPDTVLEDMRALELEPDRETFQCLISAYCQEGNIEGASKMLQVMKQKGIKVNENIFNSLIIGHSENGDLPRAQGILKVMRQWCLSPSIETYLTLACAYARHGDIGNMEKVISESNNQGIPFKDGDYLEILYVLCENNLKENVGRILSVLHPETEEFSCFANHMVVRLVNAGHDDVAYNLLQFTVENSTEESGKNVSTEFLDQLVRINTPVSKLLWFLTDMSDRKINTGGGLERLLGRSLDIGNCRLAVKLAEILVAEGGRFTKKSFRRMLSLAVSNTNGAAGKSSTGLKAFNGAADTTANDNDKQQLLFSCLRLGLASQKSNAQADKLVTPDVLKRVVFPTLLNASNSSWPEVAISTLEEHCDLSRADTVTPMIEYLIGQSKTDAASTVAAIFPDHVDPKLKFLTTASRPASPHTSQKDGQAVNGDLTSAFTEGGLDQESLKCLIDQMVVDNRPGDLEILLEARPKENSQAYRGEIYMGLLRLYARHSKIDSAIELARRLRQEQLELPAFHELLGELIEKQYSRRDSCASVSAQSTQNPPDSQTASNPQHASYANNGADYYVPTVQYNHYYYTNYFPAMNGGGAVHAPAFPVHHFAAGSNGILYNPYGYSMPAVGAPFYPADSTLTASAGTSSVDMYPALSQTPCSDSLHNFGMDPSLVGGVPTDSLSVYSGYSGGEAMFAPSLLGPSEAISTCPSPSLDDNFSSSSSAAQGRCSSSLSADAASQYHHLHWHKELKRSIAKGDSPMAALNAYKSLEAADKIVNVTETSNLIELLVRSDMTVEAAEIAQRMLERSGTHPLPKIFRYLLNRMAVKGEVEAMLNLGRHLSTKVKKDVSYDNRLCNAYLSAGRGAEFLDILVNDLAETRRAVAEKGSSEEATAASLRAIQERFPRGGAMGLLDNHPELLPKFTQLAEEFAKTGYIAPMNVLWTYHLIHESISTADLIWQKYVRSSNQIMFQKVCQVARSTGNLNLAFGLVKNLSEAEQVTPGARGIAFSCLIDCLCAAEDHKRGFSVLKDAMAQGVQLEDVNRTALVRLKSGIESLGEDFPFTIPPKNSAKKDVERSVSPVDWSDM